VSECDGRVVDWNASCFGYHKLLSLALETVTGDDFACRPSIVPAKDRSVAQLWRCDAPLYFQCSPNFSVGHGDSTDIFAES
jgi:hypothetical protein